MSSADLDAALARIDNAVRPHCAVCGKPIPARGPSDDFCSEVCQRRWARRDTVPLAPGVELPPGQVYLQLHAAAPAAAEVSSNGYVRTSLTRQPGAWTEVGHTTGGVTFTTSTPDDLTREVVRFAPPPEIDWEAVQTAFVWFGQQAMQMIEQLRPTFAHIGEALAPIAEQLKAAGLVGEPKNETVAERALRLRRERNTGLPPGPLRHRDTRSRTPRTDPQLRVMKIRHRKLR